MPSVPFETVFFSKLAGDYISTRNVLLPIRHITLKYITVKHAILYQIILLAYFVWQFGTLIFYAKKFEGKAIIYGPTLHEAHRENDTEQKFATYQIFIKMTFVAF